MVKLNERKIRWIIQEKLRGRGAGGSGNLDRGSIRLILVGNLRGVSVFLFYF